MTKHLMLKYLNDPLVGRQLKIFVLDALLIDLTWDPRTLILHFPFDPIPLLSLMHPALPVFYFFVDLQYGIAIDKSKKKEALELLENDHVIKSACTLIVIFFRGQLGESFPLLEEAMQQIPSLVNHPCIEVRRDFEFGRIPPHHFDPKYNCLCSMCDPLCWEPMGDGWCFNCMNDITEFDPDGCGYCHQCYKQYKSNGSCDQCLRVLDSEGCCSR